MNTADAFEEILKESYSEFQTFLALAGRPGLVVTHCPSVNFCNKDIVD